MTLNSDVIAAGLVTMIEQIVDLEDKRNLANRHHGIQEPRVSAMYSNMITYQSNELILVPKKCFPVLESTVSINWLTEAQKEIADKVAALVAKNAKLTCAIRLCEPNLCSFNDSQIIKFFALTIQPAKI